MDDELKKLLEKLQSDAESSDKGPNDEDFKQYLDILDSIESEERKRKEEKKKLDRLDREEEERKKKEEKKKQDNRRKKEKRRAKEEARKLQSDSAGGDDLDPVPQHGVGPSMIVENVHNAGPMPGEEQEDIVGTSTECNILNVTSPLSGNTITKLAEPVGRSAEERNEIHMQSLEFPIEQTGQEELEKDKTDTCIQTLEIAIEQRVQEEEEKDKEKKVWREFPKAEPVRRSAEERNEIQEEEEKDEVKKVEIVDNAGQPIPGEEQEEKDKGKEVLSEFPKTEKRQSDSAGAGGGDDPPNLVAHDVGPPLIVKGFKIEVTNHFYNGVVTIGFPNDDQLKNMKKFESLRVLPRSFLPCSDRQLDQMELIESLGERNPLFLFPKEVMNCEVEGGNVRNFIVVEEMLSVGEYFEDQLRKYFKSKGWEVETFVVTSPKEVRLGRLCEWWEYIRLNFISIFRELIHALLYHYRIIGKPIGNLEENVFVTKRHSKVRVLPSMDDSKTFEADIRDLCKMMKKSVLPAFLAKVEVNVEQVVSRAFRRFLDFVSKRKGAASNGFRSDITSICSIIDHPFIWSSKDRIRFIRKIHRWCKNDHETYHLIDKNLRKKFRNGNNQVHWKQQVTHPVLVAILNKPLEPGSTVKSYVNFVEIIRFHNAVYSYYNEEEYESLRSKDLNEDEIDEILISQFPLLCVWVKTIVLNRLTNNLKRIPTEDGRQVMEDLFSFEH